MTEKERLTDRKRAAIIDAAVKEFLANGYKYTSMDRIAKTADVSKRTVYKHFSSKEALFKSILLIFAEESMQIQMDYDPDRSLAEQLKEFAFNKIKLIESESYTNLLRLALAECIRSPELALSTLAEKREFHLGLTEWIEKGVEDGRLNIDNPVLASEQFISLFKNFFFWPAIMQCPSPFLANKDEVIDSAISMFLNQYEVK